MFHNGPCVCCWSPCSGAQSPPVLLWFVIGCYPNSRLPWTNSRPTQYWRGLGRHYMGTSNTQEPLWLWKTLQTKKNTDVATLGCVTLLSLLHVAIFSPPRNLLATMRKGDGGCSGPSLGLGASHFICVSSMKDDNANFYVNKNYRQKLSIVYFF